MLRRAFTVLLAGLVVAGASRCLADDASRIAVALPLSGPRAAFGRGVQAAITLAMQGGRPDAIGGSDIAWVDDACSSSGGHTAAETIAAMQPKPLVVIGHVCPSADTAAGPIYDRAGIVHITAATLPSRDPQTKRYGSRHFRLMPEGAQSGLLAAELVAAGPSARIALARDRTRFALDVLQPVVTALAAAKRPPPLIEAFQGGDKDFAAFARRLKAAGITHLMLAAYPSEAALLVSAVRAADPAIVVVATDQLADPTFARLAGAAADGVLVAFSPKGDAFPSAAAVIAELAQAGIAADRITLASYAAAEIVRSVLDEQTSQAAELPTTLPTMLTTRTFATILGPVAFDAAGHADVPSHIFYRWQAGQFSPLPHPAGQR